MTRFFITGGFGALLLWPDALPDANPPLFQAWDQLIGVLGCKMDAATTDTFPRFTGPRLYVVVVCYVWLGLGLC